MSSLSSLEVIYLFIGIHCLYLVIFQEHFLYSLDCRQSFFLFLLFDIFNFGALAFPANYLF
jgi:hypothetical protein